LNIKDPHPALRADLSRLGEVVVLYHEEVLGPGNGR
jgi:hypothetical protein